MMNIKKKLIKKIVSINPRRCAFIPDKYYLQLKFYDAFGRFMDFSNPITFNEKLQWLKVYDHKDEYTTIVDKYEAKKYISRFIGEKYIIPTLGVWDDFNQIDFDALPDQFVLKCTHDSGGLVICHDKTKFNMDVAKNKIETSLANNFYYMGREWPYKNVPHRIIAEQFMADNFRSKKLFPSGIIPRMRLVYSQSFKENSFKEFFYDEVWNCSKIKNNQNGKAVFLINRPKQYKTMKKLAELLNEKVSNIRIDFYEIDENNYFAELKFDSICNMENIDLVD